MNTAYTANPDGSVNVWNQAINLFGQHSSIKGSASIKNSMKPGALEVVFNSPGKLFLSAWEDYFKYSCLYMDQKGDYNVISTDYEKYSLGYSCNETPIIGK